MFGRYHPLHFLGILIIVTAIGYAVLVGLLGLMLWVSLHWR